MVRHGRRVHGASDGTGNDNFVAHEKFSQITGDAGGRSRTLRHNKTPTTIKAIGNQRMCSMPKCLATRPTSTGARPPPKSSPTAMTNPDAVAISDAGTASEHSGPTVNAINALLKQ